MSENFAPVTPVMSVKPVTPTDVLPDGVDAAEFQGTQVRKGSIKAVIDNIKALESVSPGTSEYEAIVAQIQELKPALIAVGVFDVFDVKDPAIAAILAN